MPSGNKIVLGHNKEYTQREAVQMDHLPRSTALYCNWAHYNTTCMSGGEQHEMHYCHNQRSLSRYKLNNYVLAG